VSDEVPLFLMPARAGANSKPGGMPMKTKDDAKISRYQPPVIRKVVLENKKNVLSGCKTASSDTRGLGPCQSEVAALCKET
jgi:hypothetical protein